MLTHKVQDIHHTSSLPSILDTYLSPESFEKTACVSKEVTQMRKLKVGGAKEAVLPPGFALDSDRVAEDKQKSLRNQRHLETYRNIHRLRNILSRHYAELLKEKVQRQRRGIKQNNSATLKTTEKLNEQKKRSTSQKLTGSTLLHDDTCLRSLPKTRHYLVLELKRHLDRCGCLQGPREQEVFRHWVDQHKTTQLEKQLQQLLLRSDSAPKVKMEDLLKRPPALPKIQVSADANSTQQDHQIAVTEGGDGGGGKQSGTRSLLASQTQTQTQAQTQDKAELRLPKVFSQELQVPRFYTLQPSFLENFSTDMHFLQRFKELLCRSRAAVAPTQHKMHLMYDISLSHMAHARRLLDINGLSSQYDKGFSTKDLMELVCPNKVLTKEPKTPGESPPPQPLTDEATTEDTQHLKEELSRPVDGVTSFQDSNSSKLSSSRAYNSWNPEEPLSIEDISSYCVSQVSKFIFLVTLLIYIVHFFKLT
ncbi:uncharacterized protein si:ch211-130h14.4 isoform X3 [Electrophorus electricus]|uniref:uncharacterized protein si:ch211-130h14.4 isoform X3 n=1 Tax=Electrophorus electricus TaxID=8005 RepID=UPI0015CF9969|nr:uncharacterized protein si:ch211-130h14.4 isoform X3 [Electrophorus electricus]